MPRDSATPFAVFATNLGSVSAERAALSIATIEEVRLGHVLWDGTRDVTTRVGTSVRSSMAYATAVEKSSQATASARTRLEERTKAMREKWRENAKVTNARDWSKTQYERTAGIRKATRERARAAWEAERVEARIERRATELQSSHDEPELRRELVRAISEAIGVAAPRGSQTPGSDWYRSVLKCLAEEYKIKDASGLSDDELTEGVLGATFDDVAGRVNKAMKGMNDEQRRMTAEKIVSMLEQEDLTAEQRREIAEYFGVDEITNETVETALKEGGVLVAGYGTLVGAGFGLYLAATTIVHAVVTTMLGITLPFAAYTTMTSGIALLLNPVVAIAIAAGLGLWFGRRQSRRLRRRLVALTVMEVHLAGAEEATSPGLKSDPWP